VAHLHSLEFAHDSFQQKLQPRCEQSAYKNGFANSDFFDFNQAIKPATAAANVMNTDRMKAAMEQGGRYVADRIRKANPN
jgi:hypothetical protein